jgi:carbonic anhydrase
MADCLISYTDNASVIDELLEANRIYSPGKGQSHLPNKPQRQLGVLTCMDSRLDLFGALGLRLGDAHLVRNAGGIVTDDVIRSLLLSQHLLGTRSIMVIHHTHCGLEAFQEETLQSELESIFGQRAPFRLGAFNDIEADVRSTVSTLEASAFLDNTEIRGVIFDVDSSELREVDKK